MRIGCGEGEVDELIGDAAGMDPDSPPVLLLEVGDLLSACDRVGGLEGSFGVGQKEGLACPVNASSRGTGWGK